MFGHICCCKMSCATPPNDPKALHMSSVKPRFAAFEKAMKSEALAAVWRPLRKQYWKLEVIAVDAPCRGQGVGTALVQAVHHLADKDGAPTYVEFAGEQLLSFYTKQGFGEHDASCWCNDQCKHYGDCCADFTQVCGGSKVCDVHQWPCANGCTYVRRDHEHACGVYEYGCYDCAQLAPGCPDCSSATSRVIEQEED